MFNLLLVSDLIERLSQGNMITGIILAAIGLSLSFLAKKITRMIRKKQEIEEADKIYLVLKAIALVMILASLIIMVIA